MGSHEDTKMARARRSRLIDLTSGLIHPACGSLDIFVSSCERSSPVLPSRLRGFA